MSNKKELTPPSEEFYSAFIGGGSPVADCEFCGRVHYEADGEFMEQGELEDLEKKHKAEPDKYIPCERISTGLGNRFDIRGTWKAASRAFPHR